MRNVLVQREMESGRTPLAVIAPTSGSSSQRRRRWQLGGGGQRPKPQLISKKGEIRLAGIIHRRARSTAENQLGTKSVLNISAAKHLNKQAAGASGRFILRAVAGEVCRVSVSGWPVNRE